MRENSTENFPLPTQQLLVIIVIAAINVLLIVDNFSLLCLPLLSIDKLWKKAIKSARKIIINGNAREEGIALHCCLR